MISREVRLLFFKELRQLRANRLAMTTSAIPPVIFLMLLPSLIATLSSGAHGGGPPPIDLGLLGDIGRDPARVPVYLLPLFCGIAGTIVPVMLAIHAVVSERESRTLELMMALPVRLSQVLTAKVLAVMAFTAAMSGTALLVPIALLAIDGRIAVLEVVAIYLELFAAMAAGAASALVIGFHAKDFRTAQNVTPAYVVPFILLTVVLSLFVGGSVTRPLALAGFYALWAAITAAHAARQNSFEQLLR